MRAKPYIYKGFYLEHVDTKHWRVEDPRKPYNFSNFTSKKEAKEYINNIIAKELNQ